MSRHPRTDGLSNTAGTSCDSPFQRFINTTCLFHKQRMLCGDPQIHFVPIARRGDGPQHSALPQIVNTVACRWVHPPSDPLQGVKVHTSTLRRGRQSSSSFRNATRRRWVRRTMLWPSEKMVVCRPSPAPIVPTAPSHGAPTRFHQRYQPHDVLGRWPTASPRAQRWGTHAARSHPDIDDDVPPVPVQKSSLPEPKSFLFVFIGLLLQLHSARRVVLSSPTTFAASCFIGRGRGMLFLCSLNRLEEWAVPFLGTSIAR
ncbi:hypothetical protein TcG_07462 [Trypanosoma cruzi]|uniref:Uncharacterized protein n=1 Tax=Trypanosoma cruzi Dm28c TaxID=1416333 RepID=V5B5F3_TRYCR|nr:hypothetical protein TCDM_09464 [Trypanosoma cruzi Dm28c]RNF14668.1 hypothetical protein TcG_07462 [Trypanosoma cruzi]